MNTKAATYLRPAKHWTTGLFSGYLTNGFTCVYGTIFPCCAISSAKSEFDGSQYSYNIICFSLSVPLVRNYVRNGYAIEGSVGTSDCCLSIFCTPCVVTQLLNEVSVRGRRIMPSRNLTVPPWKANISHASCLQDPCDFIFSFLTAPYEIINLYSEFTGAPFWFGCLCGCPFGAVNFCQVRHLLRKSYEIGGDDFMDDLITPSLCILLPPFNCTYVYKEIALMRAEITYRGRPANFFEEAEHSKV